MRIRWRVPPRGEPERPLPGTAPDPTVDEPCRVPGCRIPAPHRHARVDDAHRPVPGANAWPDDALLITYAELRRLVALHLDLAAQTMPRDRPWTWLDKRARAVSDGEAPLLISEVLE